MWAPSRAAFFYPQPVFLFPARDGCFILFQRAPFWLLRTPLQAVQQPADMVAMIPNLELPPDQFRNAGRRPQVGPVALRERSLQKQLLQAFPLSGTQLERASRRETHPQSPGAASPPGLPPAHHRTGMAADAPPHFVKRMTGIQQRQCSLTPIFQQIRAPLQSGHGGSPPNTHYCIIYAEVNRTTIPRIKANRVMSLRLWTMGSSVPQRLVCGPTLDK